MIKHTISIIFILTVTKIDGQVYVNTSRGQVFGSHFDQGSNMSALYYGQADVFLGIPFVQPPIGSLRFGKPVRLDKFPVTPYNATYYRPACPQLYMNSSEMSEDCLYLDIFTPNTSSTTKYPVMVFIHGGGFMTGTSYITKAGTVRNLVSRGVVVASISYRLGFLGFFTTFTDDFPPNLGMLDQIEALKFIQEEISNFGGDPNQVTLFGQSAGGISVSAHTYSPLSQNLFHRGIAESGVILSCFEGALGPTYRNYEFARQVCNFTIDMWNSGNYSQLKDCLMSVDISIGIQHTDDNVPLNTPYGNAICWNIVQDNYFFPDVPRNLAKKRSNKPVIIGNSKDEWAIWESIRMSKNETQYTNYTKAYAEYYLSSRFANFFGNQTQDIIGILENTYLEPGTSNDDNLAWLKFLVDIGTSFFFTGFAAKEAEFHLWNNNSNVYLYEFTYWADFYPFTAKPYPIGNWHPDPHVSEGRFLFFDNMQSINATAADLAIADFIGESWTNFAKYGTPNNSWTPTTSTGLINMEYYDIGCTSGMKSGFRALDRVTFDRTLPLLVGILPPETPDNNNGSIIPTSSPASTPTSSPTSTPTSPPASTRILTSTHKNGASIKGFGIGECIAMLLPLHIVCHFYRIL